MSFYIYYYYSNYKKNEVGSANIAYTQEKLQQQYELSLKYIETKYNKIFNYDKIFQKSSIKPEEREEVVKVLKDLQTETLTPAAQKMSQEISDSTVKVDYSSLQTLLSSLDKYINSIETFLRTYYSMDKEEEVSFLIDDLVQAQNKDSASALRKEFRTKYFSKNKAKFSIRQYEQSLSKRSGLLSVVAGNLAIAKQLMANMAETNVDENKYKLYSKTFKDLILGINGCKNRLLGFISEENLKDNITEFLSSKVEKTLTQNNGLVKGVLSGDTKTNDSQGFHYKTADIETLLEFKRMLNGENGIFSINLPGVSVKRTFSNTNNGLSKIQLKTNSKISKLIDNSLWVDNRIQHKKKLFHTFALYNIPDNPSPMTSKDIDLNNFIDNFKIATFPSAMGGSLNKNDFAYFFVVNDKVYNVFEYMKKNGVLSLSESIETSPKLENLINTTANKHAKNFYRKRVASKKNAFSTYKKRSEDIYNYIQNLSLSISMLMNL